MATLSLKHCPLCRDFCTRQISSLIKHIGLVHGNTTGSFHIECGLGGCPRLFSNFRTYRNHLYSIHTDSDALDLPEPTPLASLVDGGGVGDDDSDGCGIADDDSDGTIGSDDEENATSTTTGPSSSDLLQKAAARFVLKTKESHRLTQTAMNCIIEDVTAFNQITLGELHFAVSERLTAAGVDPQIICSLAPLFKDDGQFGQPFRGLETTYQQMKYFREHFNLIVSYHLCDAALCGCVLQSSQHCHPLCR